MKAPSREKIDTINEALENCQWACDLWQDALIIIDLCLDEWFCGDMGRDEKLLQLNLKIAAQYGGILLEGVGVELANHCLGKIKTELKAALAILSK